MNKNLFLLAVGLLVIALQASDNFIQYNEQTPLELEANILNLGYSPDQKVLVVLTKDTLGKFYVYEGIRLNTQKTINLIDEDYVINPATFAFSQDNSTLIVGSKEGSVYGFPIENGKVQQSWKYKYNIQPSVQQQFQINSISISPAMKIVVGAKNKIVILEVPANETNRFTFVQQHTYESQVKAVAWKNDDENSILVGCVGTLGELFSVYDIAQDKTVQIINEQQTSSIAVLKDGRVLQGQLSKEIQIWKWNQTNQKYESVETIPESVGASEIIIDSANQYFGAQLSLSTTVKAWQIDALTEKNLKNSQLPTLPNQLLNQTGTNLALSGNGNQILIVSDATNVVKRFDLCVDGTYLEADQCVSCTNDCKACFDANTCLTCPAEFYITADDKCATCHDITPGCLDCSDQNTCITCDEAQNRKKDVEGGLCVCDITAYPVDQQCKLCVDSLDFCEQCTDSENCNVCYTEGNINPNPVNGKCVCLDGFYFEEKVCKDCPTAITGCKICSDADTCTECDTQKNFESDGNGKCQCAAGYWFNQETLGCELCETSVTGCQFCDQAGKCTKCATEKRIPNQEGDECICQPYTFENPQNLCQDCDPYRQCLECVPEAPHACTKCDTSLNRDLVNGVCLCSKGFIENEELVCIACTVPGCEQCDTDQVCESCLTDKHFKADPQNGVCICDANYILAKNKNECLTCSQALPGCSQCRNSTECEQCDDSANFELNQDTKQCQCKSSFYNENNQCILCSKKFNYCQNCINEACSSCQDGFKFDEEKKTCSCPDDRDFDETAGTCEEKAGLSAIAIIAIIVGILAVAGGAVALIKCFKKRQSPLEDDEYEALEGRDK